MKKTFILLSLLVTMLVEAVAQNDAMFVYRNDGAINGFLKTDIDSIRYSNLDVDSVLHKEYVVQEVWTVDSVYRIPLAAIDSVSFVTPSPSYQEGVEQVSGDLYGYVISYTDSTITFKPNIPSHLLPTEGQVIVADKYEEPFTTGFSGRMTGMKEYADSIVCMFDGVYLDDIYSRLLLVGSAESYNDEINQSRAQTRAIWEDYDRKINLPASISLKAGLITAELERPSLKIDYLVCINEESLQNHVMFKARFNSAGSLSLKVSKDSTFVGDEPHWLRSIPIKVGVVSGSIEFGYFAQFSGSIEAGVTIPFEVGYSGGFLYTDSKGIVSDIPQRSFTWKEPEWKASINGSLYAGVASRLSIALQHTKVACIDLTGKFGPEVSSSYTIDAAEGIQTTLYDNLKDVEVTSSLKLELTPGYRVWFNKRKEFGGINLSVGFLKKTVPLMPSISNLSWKRQSNKSGELNGNVENDIFLPCKLGWAIYSNDEYHSTHFLPDSYWVQNSWNNNGLQYQLSDIPSTGNCKAYPIVRFLDKLNIRVPEYVDLNSIPVHITRFDVTDSEYKQGAFMNDGLYYDYKFNVSLTVEIDDLDGVADWGYVYKDPYGNIKRISLMEYGKSYTDTRYAYYRNEAHSTACLYTYVKYEGDSEYYDSEPQDYELHYDGPSAVATLETEVNIRDGKIKLRGYISGMQLYDDDECGFLYGQDSDIQSNGTKISSKHSPYINDMYWFTSEMDKPTSWESLYFCAYIYSNGKYHYGNIVEKKNYDFLRPSLKKFYETAGGEGWSESTNWLSDIEVPDWYGILEDYDGLLTLYLPDNNLTGNAVITDFRHFNSISLANNSLRNVYVANCTFSSSNYEGGPSWWFYGNKYNLGLNVENISVSDYLLIQGNIGSVSFKDCFLDDGVSISNYENDNPIEASFENVTVEAIRVRNAGNMSVVNCSGNNMEIGNGNNVVLDNVKSETMNLINVNSISISNSSFNIIFQFSNAKSVSVYKSNINGVYIESFTGNYAEFWDYVQGKGEQGTDTVQE